MSLVIDATDSARALVSASLVDDYEAAKTLFPKTQEEAAYLIIALSKLSANMVDSLARERGQDPVAMWQTAMLGAASQDRP